MTTPEEREQQFLALVRQVQRLQEMMSDDYRRVRQLDADHDVIHDELRTLRLSQEALRDRLLKLERLAAAEELPSETMEEASEGYA